MEKEDDVDVYKIITIGDSSVGKSSIIKRFIYNTFTEDTFTTIGMNMAMHKITLKNEKIVTLKLVDTAGQERYRSLAKNYFTNSDGVLFVFDLNNSESFDNISGWIKQFEESKIKDLSIPKYLIGNKNDLVCNVEENVIKDFLSKNKDFKYMSTSAKENNNIKELFQDIAEIIYERNLKYENMAMKNVKLSGGKHRERRNCALKRCLFD